MGSSDLIQLEPGTLRDEASRVRAIKQRHDDAIGDLKKLVDNLGDIWKGPSQEAFKEKFDSFGSTFDNFSNLLEEYAKLMDSEANEMENTINNNKNKIDSTLGSFKV